MHLTTFKLSIRSEYNIFTHSSNKAGFTWPAASKSFKTTSSSCIYARQLSRAIIARIPDWIGACSYYKSSISFTRM